MFTVFFERTIGPSGYRVSTPPWKFFKRRSVSAGFVVVFFAVEFEVLVGAFWLGVVEGLPQVKGLVEESFGLGDEFVGFEW